MAAQKATQAKEIVISREFDAPRERVWKAWTDPELVKGWWGPEGFTAPSIRMDLQVGGKYVFAMQGPPGSALETPGYNAGIFKEIVPNQKLVFTIFFSDEQGNARTPEDYGLSTDFPDEAETITVLFEDRGAGKTRLSVILPMPEDEEQYQAVLESGMEEGWKSQLNKLAAVIG